MEAELTRQLNNTIPGANSQLWGLSPAGSAGAGWHPGNILIHLPELWSPLRTKKRQNGAATTQWEGRAVSSSSSKPLTDAQSRKVWEELEEEFLLQDKSHSHLEPWEGPWDEHGVGDTVTPELWESRTPPVPQCRAVPCPCCHSPRE